MAPGPRRRAKSGGAQLRAPPGRGARTAQRMGSQGRCPAGTFSIQYAAVARTRRVLKLGEVVQTPPASGPRRAGDFEVHDKSRNVSWLAIPSFGESWHNLHHADPTCARHGVLKGQIDIAARTIWLAERLGWVYDVRWPEEARLTAKQATASEPSSMPYVNQERVWQTGRQVPSASWLRSCRHCRDPPGRAGRAVWPAQRLARAGTRKKRGVAR